MDRLPVQLHVLHSWGGGVAKWVQELSDAQGDRHHLMLVAWGRSEDPDRGQELRLYAGSTRGTPLRSWPLPRSVLATDAHNSGYEAILRHIIDFYAVDQVVISSLIGHSLDALRTGLPTLVVFHDYYPAWPVLQVQMESQAGFGASDLESALAEADASRLFPGRSVQHWMQLRDAYLQALDGAQMCFAAPSDSVRANLERIDPRFGELAIELIPHGFDGWEAVDYRYQPPEANIQRRLRIVVPGRISRGKGQRLLMASVEALREHADIYLLGAGKDGEAFFGTAGIHIVPDYDIVDLPQLLADIQPDLGLLLSTVSETFSYTLSELRALGIPVMATRVGSLAERIQHDTDGWLTDPEPEALVANVSALRREPERIAQVARDMSTQAGPSRSDMAQRYSKLLPAKPREGLRYRIGTPAQQQMVSADLARRQHQLQRAGQRMSERIEGQQRELDRRADWAFRLSRQLDERTQWAQGLEEDVAEARLALDSLRNEFEDRTAWALKLEEEVEQRIEHIRAQQSEIAELTIIAERHEQVIASRSWRLTKPLRFAARTARKIAERLGYKSRRAATLARRTQNSLKVRGLGGTLDRIRQEFREPASHSTPVTVPDSDVSFEALSFPQHEQPTVSIVIPVYNQYRHTFGCLRSILDARCGLSFEVIVVDDASSDETAEELARMTGMTVLRNEENLGFIGTCNRGSPCSAATRTRAWWGPNWSIPMVACRKPAASSSATVPAGTTVASRTPTTRPTTSCVRWITARVPAS
jgi:glycosyltransferase involved in cell wall biosynthesis